MSFGVGTAFFVVNTRTFHGPTQESSQPQELVRLIDFSSFVPGPFFAIGQMTSNLSVSDFVPFFVSQMPT